MSKLLKKWEEKWIPHLNDEVTRLYHHMIIFWRVQEMINSNPDIQKESSFYTFLARCYVDSAVMGIRRQIKVDRQSISLAGLLCEIIEHPDLLTREWFFRMCPYSDLPPDDRRCAEMEDFKRFDPSGIGHVDLLVVKRHLDELKELTKVCEKYADKTVAHDDKAQPKVIPKFLDLNNGIDKIQEVFAEYYCLFTGRCWDATRVGMSRECEDIFHVAWIR